MKLSEAIRLIIEDPHQDDCPLCAELTARYSYVLYPGDRCDLCPARRALTGISCGDLRVALRDDDVDTIIEGPGTEPGNCLLTVNAAEYVRSETGWTALEIATALAEVCEAEGD